MTPRRKSTCGHDRFSNSPRRIPVPSARATSGYKCLRRPVSCAINRCLSDDEETRLMGKITGRRKHLYPLVALALGTGMRRGELLNLSWPHVDFLRGVIHVVNTKTARDRIIPMSQRVREVLIEQRKT